MPTQNPRVQVTLSPSLDALVAQLAKHQRSSKAQVLRELLETAEPALQRVAALMDAASKASSEVHRGFAKSLDRAQTQIETALDSALQSVDAKTGDLVAIAEAVRSRRPARSAPAPKALSAPAAPLQRRSKPKDPPSSNRGVKSRSRAPSAPSKGGTS